MSLMETIFTFLTATLKQPSVHSFFAQKGKEKIFFFPFFDHSSWYWKTNDRSLIFDLFFRKTGFLIWLKLILFQTPLWIFNNSWLLIFLLDFKINNWKLILDSLDLDLKMKHKNWLKIWNKFHCVVTSVKFSIATGASRNLTLIDNCYWLNILVTWLVYLSSDGLKFFYFLFCEGLWGCFCGLIQKDKGKA